MKNKEDVRYIHIIYMIYTMKYYSVIKKNEVLTFAATWMDLDIITPSDVSHTKKDKYYM